MKANELMIGDWVYSSFTLSKLPCKVTYLKLHESGYGSVETTNVIGVKDIASLSPIPLTPEILEKNGFVKESRECHSKTLQYCVLIDGLWIDVSGENYFEGKLEFVHQLQHALRLCGIEKEIVL